MMLRLSTILAAALLAGCTAQELQQQTDAALNSVTNATTSAASPSVASAGLASGTPSQMMSAAVDTCMVEFRDLNGAVAAFRNAGWDVLSFGGGGDHEVGKEQVGGYVSVGEGSGGCRFESSAVSFEEAQSIGQALMDRRFEGLYQPGPPEGRAGRCDGFTVFPGRGLIVLSYDGLGQDPICPDPNGSSILVSTSS